jgi:hypothetical protein
MKQTNYGFKRKRNLWGARLENLARRIDRWLEEHYKEAFFWFMMILLLTSQILLWML